MLKNRLNKLYKMMKYLYFERFGNLFKVTKMVFIEIIIKKACRLPRVTEKTALR